MNRLNALLQHVYLVDASGHAAVSAPSDPHTFEGQFEGATRALGEMCHDIFGHGAPGHLETLHRTLGGAHKGDMLPKSRCPAREEVELLYAYLFSCSDGLPTWAFSQLGICIGHLRELLQIDGQPIAPAHLTLSRSLLHPTQHVREAPTPCAPAATPCISAAAAWRVDAHLALAPQIDGTGDPAYGLDTLAGQTRMLGAWVQTDVEIGAAAQALQITIRVVDGSREPKVFTPDSASLRTVDVVLESGHYVAALPLDGRFVKLDVVSRGDCFFGAVAAGSNYRRFREVAHCHLTEAHGQLRDIVISEWPELRDIPERLLFGAYADATVGELRGRTAHAIAAHMSENIDEDTAMVMRLIAMGDAEDIQFKLKSCADMARSYYGTSPFAAFKNAAEGMVHGHRLLDTFYQRDQVTGRDADSRQQIVETVHALVDIAQSERVHVTASQRSKTRDDVVALYGEAAVPACVKRLVMDS